MESDTTVDGCSPPVSPQPVPSGAAAVDPLVDANCLRCGYALRGLTEYRCPECGTPFDPSDFVDTFVPKWPTLLQWWAAGLFAESIVLSPTVLQVIGVIWSPPAVPGGSYPFYIIVYYVAWVAECLWMASMSMVAVKGLRGHHDWGRQAIIALILGLALLEVGGTAVICILPDARAGVGGWPNSWCIGRLIIGILSDLVPALMLTIYLTTGLRRVSLPRDPAAAPPALKTACFREQTDWLLLLRLFMFVLALDCAGYFVAQCSVASYRYYAGGALVVHLLVLCVAFVGCLVAARRLWRDPIKLRGSVCVAVGLFGCAWIVGLWESVAAILTVPGQSWDRIALTALAYVGMLLPRLALPLFVFKGIDRADIEHVAWLQRNGTRSQA